MQFEEIERYAAACNCDLEHSKNVSRLAGELFDACHELHDLQNTDRELLLAAGLLHDIGWKHGQRQHHRNSARMIHANPPGGLTDREILIIANVARYHRKALPDLAHADYARLAPTDREIVSKLSALIRIADGLDVTHDARISINSLAFDENSTILRISSAGDPLPNLYSARKKADLFELVFARKLEFQVE
jgi:exopolyphosphatase/guanosine-5'-triphosphate,3'-diphosphate pyrophosphatase